MADERQSNQDKSSPLKLVKKRLALTARFDDPPPRESKLEIVPREQQNVRQKENKAMAEGEKNRAQIISVSGRYGNEVYGGSALLGYDITFNREDGKGTIVLDLPAPLARRMRIGERYVLEDVGPVSINAPAESFPSHRDGRVYRFYFDEK